MVFAKRVFLLSAIYGVVVLTPMYFAEGAMAAAGVPLSHPESHYGFVGAALAFQALFFVISRDPARMRPAMIPAVLEKASFGAAVAVLALQGRVPGVVMVFAAIDVFWGVLFATAWFKTAPVRA